MIVTIATPYHTGQVRLTFHRYVYSGNHAILIDELRGTPLFIASVNPPRMVLPRNQVAMKGWGENVGLPDALVAAGVLEPSPVSVIPSGHVEIQVYRMTPFALAEAYATAQGTEMGGTGNVRT